MVEETKKVEKTAASGIPSKKGTEVLDSSGKDTKVAEEITKDVKAEKKVVKKVETKTKEMAMANGFSLRISPKHSIAICKVIRGKSPEAAIVRLEDVVKEKRVIPMAGMEVGHKKGKGLAGGRFPKNACIAIIEVLKQVRANAVVAGIENPVITIAKADRAAAPLRKGGRKAKRAHFHVEVRTKIMKVRAK